MFLGIDADRIVTSCSSRETSSFQCGFKNSQGPDVQTMFSVYTYQIGLFSRQVAMML